jgi:curli biogenesis system outer membrane secretion channel CsgG
MKRASLPTLILCALMATKALAEPQEMDQELSALADKLAAPIKECGKKKVTVLDFTDLQGSSSGELGKYIAEQLSVDLVMSKRDFSVLDRANLKSILAEHKLTATGLVDPENAKKLGQFAGVDVLILGTIIPKNNHVSLTAKIITTDTAEIIGAARADFKSDETVKALMEKPSTENQTVFSQPKKSIASKQFGNLNILVDVTGRLKTGHEWAVQNRPH